MHRIGGERLTGEYYKRREYWNGVSLAAVDKLQKRSVYCQLKAWARLVQIIVVVLPAWCWALGTGDIDAQFLRTCRRTKYVGYWRGVMGFAKKAQLTSRRLEAAQVVRDLGHRGRVAEKDAGWIE